MLFIIGLTVVLLNSENDLTDPNDSAIWTVEYRYARVYGRRLPPADGALASTVNRYDPSDGR